ncbi:hypothetical protein Y032_0038g3650 [Ancylostoma ceylanicum]|uniref:Uncharacterized protein n=1 Tax=Ancylostoma ceylanicum TaxID=53326 RepID=A0A016UJY4_9BILA|nr:hypothetical protein Y032_0038g3650 [Ancylostoma ceylanicum]
MSDLNSICIQTRPQPYSGSNTNYFQSVWTCEGDTGMNFEKLVPSIYVSMNTGRGKNKSSMKTFSFYFVLTKPRDMLRS